MNSATLMILPRMLTLQRGQEVELLIGPSLAGSHPLPCLSCGQHLATLNVEREASLISRTLALTTPPSHPTRRCYPREMKTSVLIKTSVWMFIAILFIINWKHPKCPSEGEWLDPGPEMQAVLTGVLLKRQQDMVILNKLVNELHIAWWITPKLRGLKQKQWCILLRDLQFWQGLVETACLCLTWYQCLDWGRGSVSKMAHRQDGWQVGAGCSFLSTWASLWGFLGFLMAWWLGSKNRHPKD